MKRHIWAVLYSIALVLFTVYVLLDTFVITRVYSVVEEQQTENSETDASEKTASGKQEPSGSHPSGRPGSGQDGQNEENGSAPDRDSSDSHSSGRPGGSRDGSAGKKHGSASDPDSSDSGTSEQTEDAQDSTESTGEGNGGNSTKEAEITDASYDDGQIQITITQYREYDTEIYAADIMLSSPDYLKTALAQNAYGKNVTEKTSAMAEEHDAILAINGDYYGVQESGYVLRNGVLYRSTADDDQEDLVIYQDGSFGIIREGDVSAETLLNQGAEQILSFGPALAENGEIVISEDEEVGKAMVSNPRTAIAILDELHYLFLVSDGRTGESAGLTLYELAETALELGAQTVYNLDGGGSSTLWFNGAVINQPTAGNGIHERSVSDIVYIGY